MFTKTSLIVFLSIFIAMSIRSVAQMLPYKDSPFGMDPAQVVKTGYVQPHFADAETLGVKWNRPSRFLFWNQVQPNLSTATLIFGFYDTYFSEVPKDINIIANIATAPKAVTNYNQLNSYLPIDTAKYIAFVKAAVERYDGDGVNDMPELSNPILYWQVGNEPNCIVKQDFAKLQKMTYTAIKEVCPQCKVLVGGAAQTVLPGQGFITNKDDYLKGFNNSYKPILQELNGEGFDIFDFHWYGNATGDYKKLKPVYEQLKLILGACNFSNIPIWITEMGTYSGFPAGEAGTPYTYQTELQQASDYLKRFVFSLSIGVKKIFPAFGLMEGFTNTDGYFDHTGFIYDSIGSNDLGLGVKKLSYYSYKKMVETLEGSDWSNIVTVQEDTVNKVYIYKFTRQETPIWVSWNDSSVARTITISGINSNRVRAIEAVPKDTSGKDVTNYATAFHTDTLVVTNGMVMLTLGDHPVFVETLSITSVEHEDENIPRRFFLYQNYPNPFNPTTTINFSIPQHEQVTLKVYDMLGREVATLLDGELNMGEHTIAFDGKDLASGIYFYRLSSETFVKQKKMVILR